MATPGHGVIGTLAGPDGDRRRRPDRQGHGMTFLRRDRAARVAAALASTLIIAACAAEPVATDAAGTAAPPVAAPAPAAPAPPATIQSTISPALPEPDTSDRPRIAVTNPDLGWPFDDDLDRIEAFPTLLGAAFDVGVSEGMRFLAGHSWPDGYTADAMLACRASEPTPTYADLDADAHRYRVEFRPVSPAPGFQYPPTGEYPADAGLRVYLTWLIVVTEQGGVAVDTFNDIGRLAVRPDGTVVMFPTCFPFLPGQFLAHRVTDGDVGGYTDAEAEGDIRVIFTSSPSHLQAEVCERHAARDFAALEFMIMPPDIESIEALIPRSVMDRTLTQLCASRVR